MEGKKQADIGSGDKAYYVITLGHTMTLTEARMQKVVFLHDHKTSREYTPNSYNIQPFSLPRPQECKK